MNDMPRAQDEKMVVEPPPPGLRPKASVAALQVAPPAQEQPPQASVPAAKEPARAKEQGRSLAFLYPPGQKEACAEFAAFLGSVALKVSKKPMGLRTALALEVKPDAGAPAILEAVKSSGAAGAILWLGAMSEAQAQDIEYAFSKAEFFLRPAGPDKAQKRVFAMDVLFEIMLLKAG